jgi:hypothetical protein
MGRDLVQHRINAIPANVELNEINKYRTQPTERQVTNPVLHLSWERCNAWLIDEVALNIIL